jgi:hypothetical protein
MVKKFDVREALMGTYDDAPADVGKWLEKNFGPGALTQAQRAYSASPNIEEITFYSMLGEAIATGLSTPLDKIIDYEKPIEDEEIEIEEIIETHGEKIGDPKSEEISELVQESANKLINSDNFLESFAKAIGKDPSNMTSSEKRELKRMAARSITGAVIAFMKTMVIAASYYSSAEAKKLAERTDDISDVDYTDGFDADFQDEFKMLKWWSILKRDYE